MPAYRSVFAGVAQLAEEVGQASRANRELFEQLVAADVRVEGERLAQGPQLPAAASSQAEIDALLASFD